MILHIRPIDTYTLHYINQRVGRKATQASMCSKTPPLFSVSFTGFVIQRCSPPPATEFMPPRNYISLQYNSALVASLSSSSLVSPVPLAPAPLFNVSMFGICLFAFPVRFFNSHQTSSPYFHISFSGMRTHGSVR